MMEVARPRTPSGELEWYLRRRAASGSFYAKSRELAKDVDLSPSQIGLVLGELADSPGDLVVERWAYTGATTWKIALR